MFTRKCSRLLPLVVAPVALICSATSHAVDFKVDGFGSAYYGQALSKDLLPYGFTSTNPDFYDFSLIGADVMAKFNDDWSAAAELIAEGQSGPQTNYTAFAEWAYLNWTPMQGLSVKLGRQRMPVWTASEYINNHFELPYRTMPQIVFQLSPFAAFDGASVTQSVDVADNMKASLQVFGGTPVLNIPTSSVVTFSGERLFGARANLEGDGWQANRNNQTLVWSAPYSTYYGSSNAANVTTLTAGYRFDKFNIVSWGEYGYTFSKDGTTIPLNGVRAVDNGKAGYVLVGYRLDKFMPRYTFAQANLNYGFENGKVTTHTIGVNYNANEHVTLKAEYEIDLVPTPGGGPGFLVTQNATSPTGTSGSAFYIGGDFYF
jgi:hypothetical protein